MKHLLKKYSLMILILLSPFLILEIVGCGDNPSEGESGLPPPTVILQSSCTNPKFVLSQGGLSRPLNTSYGCTGANAPLSEFDLDSSNDGVHINQGEFTRLEAESTATIGTRPRTLRFLDEDAEHFETTITIKITPELTFLKNVSFTPDLTSTGNTNLRYLENMALVIAAETNSNMTRFRYVPLDCQGFCSAQSVDLFTPDNKAAVPSPFLGRRPIIPKDSGMPGSPKGRTYIFDVWGTPASAPSGGGEKTSVDIVIFSPDSIENQFSLDCTIKSTFNNSSGLDTFQMLTQLIINESSSLIISNFVNPQFFLFQDKGLGFVPDETHFKISGANLESRVFLKEDLDLIGNGVYQVIFSALVNGEPVQKNFVSGSVLSDLTPCTFEF